tara:strand:+ start:1596 stop:1946 length:351 start_codon:yes stop_codon:yes gene_type:complete
MRAIFENQNELLYISLYNYQDVTIEKGQAILSVISSSDMAYEWYKKVDFKICENDKYLGVIITTENKKIISECGAYELIENVEKFYIKQNVIDYVEKLNDYKHQVNTLKKYFKRVL